MSTNTITCAGCGDENPAHRRICQACGDPLKRDLGPVHAGASCNFCHHPDPNIRMLHWMNEEPSALRTHLGIEFPGSKHGDLVADITKMVSRRDRNTGNPQYRGVKGWPLGLRVAMENFHDAFVARYELTRRADESQAEFAKRCIAAMPDGGLKTIAARAVRRSQAAHTPA